MDSGRKSVLPLWCHAQKICQESKVGPAEAAGGWNQTQNPSKCNNNIIIFYSGACIRDFRFLNWSNSQTFTWISPFFFCPADINKTAWRYYLPLSREKPDSGFSFPLPGTLTAARNKHCFSFVITDKYLTEQSRWQYTSGWGGLESNTFIRSFAFPFCPELILL